MTEPSYLLIDTDTGRRVEITTNELQALIWRMDLQQPLDGAYFERAQYDPKTTTTNRTLPNL